jgi:hypothetical protein
LENKIDIVVPDYQILCDNQGNIMYKRRHPDQKPRYLVVTAIALCGIAYMVFSILDGWTKYRESNRRLEASASEVSDLQKQYEELQKEKAHASSTTGVEMEIRSKFDLMKPEEKVVFIGNEEAPKVEPEEKGIKKFFKTFKNFFN